MEIQGDGTEAPSELTVITLPPIMNRQVQGRLSGLEVVRVDRSAGLTPQTRLEEAARVRRRPGQGCWSSWEMRALGWSKKRD